MTLLIALLINTANAAEVKECSTKLVATINCTTDSDCESKAQKLANKFKCYIPETIGVPQINPVLKGQ